MRHVLSLILILGSIALLTSPAAAAPLDQLCVLRGLLPAEGIGSVHLGGSFVGTVHRLGHPTLLQVNHTQDPSAAHSPWQPITRPEDGTQDYALADFGPKTHLIEVRAINNAIAAVTIRGISECHDNHG